MIALKYGAAINSRQIAQLTGLSESNVGTILQLHDYVTFESDGYVVVMPDASARQVPQPMLTKGQTYADAQIAAILDTLSVVTEVGSR